MKRGDFREINVDGAPVGATFLGSGHFATAYRLCERNAVVLYVKQGECYGKEILSHVQGPHLPPVVQHDENCVRGKYYDVWEMPFYPGIVAGTEAWAHYRVLEGIRDAVGMRYGRERRFADQWGTAIWQDTINEAAGKVPSSLTDDLQALLDWASNYGCGMCVEFAPRNLSTGAYGQLILRDIVFDAERIHREQQKRLAQRRW